MQDQEFKKVLKELDAFFSDLLNTESYDETDSVEVPSTEGQSDEEYIEYLEDQIYDLERKVSELSELLELERAKKQPTQEDLEVTVSIDKCYDILMGVYSVLSVVDGLNKQEVSKLRDLMSVCMQDIKQDEE